MKNMTQPRLNSDQVYFASLALRARDGDMFAYRSFNKDSVNGLVPEEIMEFFWLSFRDNIRVDSPEHKRLNELSAKYETEQTINYQPF